MMARCYEDRKDSDGFLYIIYTEESTLGEGYTRLEDFLKL